MFRYGPFYRYKTYQISNTINCELLKKNSNLKIILRKKKQLNDRFYLLTKNKGKKKEKN